MRYFRMFTAVMLLAVIALLSRPAHAGRFANLVVITVTTTDTVVDVPIDPASRQVHPPLLKQLIPAKRRVVAQPVKLVCGPNGCPTVADHPPAPTPAIVEGPQHSIVRRSAAWQREAALMERGPVRRLCRGLLGRVKNFIVAGGPIRQRLQARR